MNLRFVGAVALALLVSGCTSFRSSYDMGLDEVERPASAKKQYGEQIISKQDDGAGKYVFEDKLLKAIIIPLGSGFLVRLENRTNNSIKVNWDEAAYVDTSGQSHRVVHNGVRLMDRNAPQPPSIIVRQGVLDDHIIPSDHINWTGKDWSYSDLLPDVLTFSEESAANQRPAIRALVGKRIQVLLPLVVENVTNEYVFSFKINEADIIDKSKPKASAAPAN